MIKICGIDEVDKFLTEERFSHILAIRDIGYVDKLNPNYKHLILNFSDCDKTDTIAMRRYPKDIVLATREQIIQGLDFILDADNVLCTCHAGISRSTAFGILHLINRGAKIEDAIYRIQQIRMMYPNQHVIELGDEILGLNGELVGSINAWKFEKRKKLDS